MVTLIYNHSHFMICYGHWSHAHTTIYEYDFVHAPPDRLLCQICQLPCRDPYMTLCCGHGFCKSCLDGQRQFKSVSYTCPICPEPEFKTVPYKALEREIRALHIYCTNKEKGCEWQGELNNINNHLSNVC